MDAVERWQTVINNLMGVTSPAILAAGNNLWGGLAVIMLVWYGAQVALERRGLDVAGFVELVIGMSIPLGMLQFYQAAAPGLGLTTPEMIRGMGGWLQEQIVSDGGTDLLARFMAFAEEVWELVSGTGGWWAILDGVTRWLMTLFTLVVVAGVLAIAIALGLAQVIWGYFGLALGLLMGPIFIPWLMVPQLSWLFWGWLKTVVQYSFYGAVAAAIWRVTAEVGVALLPDIGDGVEALLSPAGSTLIIQRGLTVTGFGVAAILASLKVGEFVQLLMSGAGSLGSGVGTRVSQVARMASPIK